MQILTLKFGNEVYWEIVSKYKTFSFICNVKTNSVLPPDTVLIKFKTCSSRETLHYTWKDIKELLKGDDLEFLNDPCVFISRMLTNWFQSDIAKFIFLCLLLLPLSFLHHIGHDCSVIWVDKRMKVKNKYLLESRIQ